MNDTLLSTINSIVGGTADPTLAHNNANKDSHRIPVMRDMVAGEVAKELALTTLLPERVAQAHIDGVIHYHDLDYAPLFPGFNCMLVDLEGMLTNGFKMGNAEIETPKSITTACAITAQIIANVASHTYGGTTINRLDEVLAPYVKKSYLKHLETGKRFCRDDAAAQEYADTLTKRECADAFQGLEYECNTLFTANGQTPFVTFGFGLGTCRESRLVQKSLLRTRIKGLGKNQRTAIFPKLVMGVKEGVNRKRGDVNYDIKQLALECAAKRMYPDILNYDKTVEITGGYKAPMGCRSFLGEHESGYEGRNNLGVVSLNLPRIALDAGGDYELFWELLDERLVLCKQALMTRIDRLRGVRAKVAPILYTEGACGVRLDPEDEIMTLFENGRASISLGYIGLHETCNQISGNVAHPFDDQGLQHFAKAVVARLREAVDTWKAETGFAFSLYSTPSESLCDRFCRIDTERYGEVRGVTDKGYYTNSFHLDVWKQVSQFDKVDFETGYAEHASGGHISYVEYPRVKLPMQMLMLETVWDYSYDRVPYLGSNVPIDECYDCGFQGDSKRSEAGFTCPHCGGSNIEVTKRVCGYLSSPDSRPLNPGKQREVIGRVKHTGGF